MVRLVVSGKGDSRVVELPGPVITLGRGTEATVRLADDGMSRRHSRLEVAPDGSCKITDLGSRNGTRVNGELVREGPVNAGDVILIGTTKITVDAITPAAGAPAPAAPSAAAPPPAPPTGPGYCLVFLAGPSKGQTHPLTHATTRIGRRRRDNEIALFDTGISNRHAEIRKGPEGLILADVGSRNGTLLNGHRVTQSPLKPGDRIQLGHTLIEVRAAGPDGHPTATLPKPDELRFALTDEAGGGADDTATDEHHAEEPEAPAEEGSGRSTRIALLATAIVLAAGFFGAVYAVRILRRQRAAPAVPSKVGEQPEGPKAGVKAVPSTHLSPSARPGGSADLKAALAEADTLAGAKRYGEAIRRLEDFAKAPGASQADALEARERVAEIDAKARGELQVALEALRRAELTGLGSDFAAARKAVEDAAEALKGTVHEAAVTKAAQALQAARQDAPNRRRDTEAAALLAAAKAHRDRREPHIAAMHCRELLTRYPDAPAAAEAKALLEMLSPAHEAPNEK
mgnify:CR=1 FL=1